MNKYINGHLIYHVGNLDIATTTKDGLISHDHIEKLIGIETGAQVNRTISDSINTSDSTIVASALAVKTAYDRANTAKSEAVTSANGYTDGQVSTLRDEILGGASGAYDTLLEIENELKNNDTDIGSILTTLDTKLSKTGGTISGNLTVQGIGNLLRLVTTDYVNNPTRMTFESELGSQGVYLENNPADGEIDEPGTQLLVGSLDGTTPVHLSVDGNIYSNGSKVWHSGNLIPSQYAKKTDSLEVFDGEMDSYFTDTSGYGQGFKVKSIPFDSTDSYRRRVILLVPQSTTNTSQSRLVSGRITVGKHGSNISDIIDVQAQSVYNNVKANIMSTGYQVFHRLVTCQYNGIPWVAIDLSYGANPYNYALFEGFAYSDTQPDNQLKCINYEDLYETTITNSEIYNSIAEFTGTGNIRFNNKNVWHAGNDGANSGLDADRVNGVNFHADATDPTGATRLNMDGYFYATRVYNAVYNDLAEFMYTAEDGLEPGELLIWDDDKKGLTTTDVVGDKRVVGVYSDTDGFTLGANDIDNKVPIGLAGRVWVKIKVPVENGDGLITSEDRGYVKPINDIPGVSPFSCKLKAMESFTPTEEEPEKRIMCLII